MKKPLTKRKMYQKRRKREKEEKRRNQKQQTSIKGATVPGMTVNIKYNNNKDQQQPYNTMNMANTAAKSYSQRFYNNQHIPHSQYTNPFNAYTNGMRQWWQTYCTAIQYHNEQGKQWKATCSSEDTHSESHTELLERYAEEYETSSDEEDEEEHYLNPIKHVKWEQHTIPTHEEQQEDIDTEYLQFLEITHRHREELRLQRAAENIS